MPTTSPDSIYYADGTTPASLADITAAIATSVQDALDVRETHSFSWADSTARAAQTGMTAGDIGYQVDNDVFYIYTGAAWAIWAKQPTAYTPTFTNFTASSTNFTFSVAGGFVNVSGKAVSSSTVGGGITISTPSGFDIDMTTLGAADRASQIGVGGVTDTSASTYYNLGVRTSSSNLVVVSATNTAGTYASIVATAAGVPITWASGDILYVNFSYPVL